VGYKRILEEVHQQLGITSIAIPALGCGNGGLNWLGVMPLIESAFVELPEVKAIIFEPMCK
jgi:O-acetyl-ADP-ribose deacetylase (regulator of RNase III)